MNVETKKDKNNRDSDTKAGNNSAENNTPTNKLLEKSGTGIKGILQLNL